MPLEGLIHSPSSTPVLYEGIIREDANSVLDQLEVIIPAFSRQLSHGPCPWTPRIDDAGNPAYPSAGDRCIVAFAETTVPGTPEPWIVSWWPS